MVKEMNTIQLHSNEGSGHTNMALLSHLEEIGPTLDQYMEMGSEKPEFNNHTSGNPLHKTNEP